MRTLSLLFLTFIALFSLITCTPKGKDQENESASQIENQKMVYGIGRVLPENDMIPLYSAASGIITKILIKENDTVSKGQVIIELDHQLEDERMRQVTAGLDSQAAQIIMDMAIVEEIEAQIVNTDTELKRLEALGLISAVTKQSIDDLRTTLKVLNANLKGAKAQVDFSKAKKKELQSELALAGIQRNQKFIKAPVNGRLVEFTALLGEVVSTSNSFGFVQSVGKTIVVCEVDESTAHLVKVGQKGWIRNVGSLDTLSLAEVFFTSSSLNRKSLFFDQVGEREDRRVRKVKLNLEDSKGLLLNTRVECALVIAKNY